MLVCVIDGRGGGLGKRLISGLRDHVDAEHEIVGLGTNEAATKAMRRAGATRSGTGEQVIKQTVPTADVILASLNLVLPGAMLGEVTPDIACAILNAPGHKLLLPITSAHVEVVRAEALTLATVIGYAMQRVRVLLKSSALA